jgi:hypothetical protein
MTLASDLLSDLGDIFLTDFAVDVTATTWGTTPKAIIDKDYVEYNDISSVAPFLLMKDADVPSTATSGDLFTVECVNYKMVDKQYYEPGVSRIVLARA